MDEARNCGEMNRELLLRGKRKSYSAEPSGGAGRPPDLCDAYNRRRLTRTGGHTAELLAAGDEERRSDGGCQPRAYARPGSWTAGRPVDLAAAIAHEENPAGLAVALSL